MDKVQLDCWDGETVSLKPSWHLRVVSQARMR